MQARSRSEWPRDLDRLRERFEAWRGRRDRERRIPPALWRAAVKLARAHGISAVSRAVRVDYYSLKRRLEADRRPTRADNGAHGSARGRSAGPGDGRFVELPVPVMPGVPPCVLELEDRRGGRLRLEVHGLDVDDAAKLVQSVWNRRR